MVDAALPVPEKQLDRMPAGYCRLVIRRGHPAILSGAGSSALRPDELVLRPLIDHDGRTVVEPAADDIGLRRVKVNLTRVGIDIILAPLVGLARNRVRN